AGPFATHEFRGRSVRRRAASAAEAGDERRRRRHGSCDATRREDAMTFQNQLRSGFARAFRPFSKVHPDEVGIVVLMTLTTFLLLTAYYLLKTVREPLILLQGGAEMK